MNSRAILLGALVGLAVAFPASAGPRDDVLAGMNKCVSVADDKERLACYDALKPQVQAAAAETPQQVAKEEGSSWFGLDHLFEGRPAPQVEPKQFGSDRLPAQEQAKVMPPAIAAAHDLESITATLTDFAFNHTDRFIVFLDNGQVWQQSDGDSDKAHFRTKPGDNTVIITRGMIGTYQLQIGTAKKIYKVTRIK